MTILKVPMYRVVCNHIDCVDLRGEWTAWEDPDLALDEWKENDGVQTPDGQHYCPDHIPDEEEMS